MAKLQQILQGEGVTLVAKLHMQQIGMFMRRTGIELYPAEDSDSVRAKLLNQLWKENHTALHLNHIWESGAKSGQLLLYVRPNGSSYRLSYYPAHEFEPYYNSDGELATVTIETQYKDESGARRWKRIRITDTTIAQWESASKVDANSPPDSIILNPYGILPCVVIDNTFNGIGKRGRPEFAELEGQIETHDWQIDQIHGNLEFFGGPIFFSSRSKAEMVEAGMISSRHSIAEAQGYGTTRSIERIKARRIFDNLEPGEQVGFASPEPIDEQSIEYINQYEAAIRTALGSVDEKYIAAGTVSLTQPTEIHTMLAPAIATANAKCEAYLTYGIAAAYEIMMQMAQMDKVIPTISTNTEVKWRHLGEVFPSSPNDMLTKSIVCRNLLRLGVNIKDCLKFLFPDKKESELEELLSGGFAYELINGIARVAQTLQTAKDEETGEYAITIDQQIEEILNGRPNSKQQQSGKSSKRSRAAQGRKRSITGKFIPNFNAPDPEPTPASSAPGHR